MNQHSLDWDEVFGPEFSAMSLDHYGIDNPKNPKFNKDIDVKYNLNQNGFRSSEFGLLDHKEEKILYLGSSTTFGVGLEESALWCSRVSKAMAHKQYINLSKGACGSDYLTRMLNRYINYTRPTKVIALYPSEYYFDIMVNSKTSFTYSPQWDKSIHQWAERHTRLYDSLTTIHSSEPHNVNLFCRDLIITKTACDLYNIPFYWTFEKYGKNQVLLEEFLDKELLDLKMPFNFKILDHDRSGTFGGPESHKFFAKDVIDFLNTV